MYSNTRHNLAPPADIWCPGGLTTHDTHVVAGGDVGVGGLRGVGGGGVGRGGGGGTASGGQHAGDQHLNTS